MDWLLSCAQPSCSFLMYRYVSQKIILSTFAKKGLVVQCYQRPVSRAYSCATQPQHAHRVQLIKISARPQKMNSSKKAIMIVIIVITARVVLKVMKVIIIILTIAIITVMIVRRVKTVMIHTVTPPSSSSRLSEQARVPLVMPFLASFALVLW